MTTRSRYLLIFFLLLTIPIAFGCAGPRERSPHHARLSKAMEKASDDYQGERKLATDADAHPWPDDQPPDVRADRPSRPEPTPPPGEPAPARKAKDKEPGVIGLGAGYGLIQGDDIYQLNHLDLSLGFYLGEKERLEGFIGYGYALINESAELNSSIDDAWLLTIGARYKIFSTPRDTFLGHYYTLGVAYNMLAWSYSNTIQLDGRGIDSDSLQGFELFAGMGFHLAQTEHFQLGLEILPSVILWEAYTHEGFDNDVFGPFYMLKLRLTLSFL